MHVLRGLLYSVCVCVSVTSLTAMLLTYEYKERYELKAKSNVIWKVFDLWISLKILCSKVTAFNLLTTTNFDGFDGQYINDYW